MRTGMLFFNSWDDAEHAWMQHVLSIPATPLVRADDEGWTIGLAVEEIDKLRTKCAGLQAELDESRQQYLRLRGAVNGSAPADLEYMRALEKTNAQFEKERNDLLDTLDAVFTIFNYNEKAAKEAEKATGSTKVSQCLAWHVRNRDRLFNFVEENRNRLHAELLIEIDKSTAYRKTLIKAEKAIEIIRHVKPDGCECEACEEIAETASEIRKTLERNL